jgi:hypothetical protein
MVEETAAALTDGRILVLQASANGADRVFTAPQQFVISRDGALRVAQARDEGWLPVLANMPGPGISSGPLYQERGRGPLDLQTLANSRSQ